jgi:predicted NACHT family NTPase
MTRTVRRTNAAPERREDSSPRPYSDFTGYPNVVLLGDPGAGKTHLFREAAVAEAGRFIKARAFLNTPAPMLQGSPLFIDGLDEKRAGRGDRDTVDALVTKLFAVNPPKVRISCRAADWLGESDLAALGPFFEEQGEVCVLHLESLSRPEQIAVLAVKKGISAEAAEAFVSEANDRGLGDFLENPQNLIMLWDAVQTGSWPTTRKELFELSTKLMLQEFDGEHARFGSGTYTVEELRPVAGAICAARLISDVDAISLTNQEGTVDIPGYRSLRSFPPEKVEAALGRRVFNSGSEPETVDYAHRTTAEFLAAEFLAVRVRDGLPFGRVAALIGVDGHPATELRGLHAWLAVHLPEYADQLIEADAYGVLTYGDAAFLSPSSCARLVRALDELSRSNPWFRSGNWQARSIGALARPDMVDEYRTILNSPDAGFGVRSVVVDALSLGTPPPAMLPDLEAVLVHHAGPYAERAHALNALLRLGDPGKTAICNAFQTRLGNAVSDLRLRAEIVRSFYDDPYGPSDVISLVNDLLHTDETHGTGLLWNLADSVPVGDLPAILDGINLPSDEADPDRRYWEAGSFYARILVRAWRGPGLFDPSRAMDWLRKRQALGGRGERRARDLRDAMRDTPNRLRRLASHFFSSLPLDEHRWLAFQRFREAILLELNSSTLAEVAVEQMGAAEAGEDRRLFLYEVALALAFGVGPAQGVALFNDLYAMADQDPTLRTARDAAMVSNLPPGYFNGRFNRTVDAEVSCERQRQEFDRDIQQIRIGAHLSWLTHLARIYFALYSDVERGLSPRARIAAWLGEERTNAALEALAAAPSRNDLPTFADVMALAADHQHYDWWFALAAGLNERWSAGQGLLGLSDDFLKAMLVFDITTVSAHQDGDDPVHPWRQALSEGRPEIVRDAYLAVSHVRLSRNEQFVQGLPELLTEPAFAPYRRDIALDLLRQFPNANPFQLGNLLDAVVKVPAAHEDFIQLASPIISGAVTVDQRQRDLWLVAAYLLSPARFQSDVRRRADAYPAIVFDLRDRCGFGRSGESTWPMQLPTLEFMAQLTGSLFRETPHPSTAWWGDTNAWDASEHFRTLTNMISASPSEAATEALMRLEAEPHLVSYKPHILYALASQRQRRRDAEYDRPDWPKTVLALANGVPATVADLHALLVAHLRDLAHQIARANIDMYKQFWNLDSYAKPMEPRPEEACRDVLIQHLRPLLLPLGITVEPEGHMVGDKRADISVAMPARKILCELKRDYHAEVWTALMGQLERFYAHDPEAKGFGVYCVFWFGNKRPRPVPGSPLGKTPQSATGMEAILKVVLPEKMRARLAVIVIDVSGEV